MHAFAPHGRTRRSRAWRAALAGILASALAVAGIAGPVAAGSTTTVVVVPASVVGSPAAAINGHWTIDDQTSGGSLAFVSGPNTPPLGSGSLQLSVPSSSAKIDLFNYDWYGRSLSDLAAMSFSTYTTSSTFAPVFQIQAFLNDSGPSTHYSTINFEPYVMGTITPGDWQAWPITGSTLVWATHMTGSGSIGYPESWSDFRGAFPSATMIAVGFNAGSGWTSFSGNADDLSITTAVGDTTIYDFEPASASCPVRLNTSNNVETLLSDCVMDHTVYVPDGWTLDGAGHSITGVDPAGGHFLGAVVENAGPSANVSNLTVTVSGLTDICDSFPNALAGIRFDGASGAITNDQVLNINQGPSGCQEGNAIDVRDTAGTSGINVTVAGNTVSDYQKTGILANGVLAATITGNTVSGLGPVPYIAQNGIQISRGASALVRSNSVSGNWYTGPSYVSCGLLFYQAGGVKQQSNDLFANQRELCNVGRGGGTYNPQP